MKNKQQDMYLKLIRQTKQRRTLAVKTGECHIYTIQHKSCPTVEPDLLKVLAEVEKLMAEQYIIGVYRDKS